MRNESRRYEVLCAVIGMALLLVAGSDGKAWAQIPCGAAGAPQCDGACSTGQNCQEQSGVCVCKPDQNPCGIEAGPPQCYGTCPPANPICADIAGNCQCVSGATPSPTPTATLTPGAGTPTATLTLGSSTPGPATPTPTPTPATSTTPTCADSPVASCRTPAAGGKASLQIKKHQSDDSKDMLIWKWSKGSATSKADFGSPTTTTNYLLCVYDGGSNEILDSVAIGGDSCGGVPCWQDQKKGFQYKNKDKSPSGPQQIKLKEGDAGKAQIQVKAKGSHVDPPLLPLLQPVTVQLVNSNGLCWQAVYSAPATKNEVGPPGLFKDKAD